MQRYNPQAKETGMPNAYMQNHVDGAATGVGVAQSWGKVGDVLQKLGEVAKRRNDEWDATKAMEANNQFIQRMTSYMDDPDTGVTNKMRLGLAQGVTKRTSADADEFVKEIEGSLENDAQKQAFRAMSERSKTPFWKQASNFETNEVKTFRDQVFKTTLESGSQMVMRDPMDESFFETAAVQGATAIRAQYVGSDEKVVDAAVKEYTSSLEAQRIALVAQDNPLLGEELIKSSPYLTPEDAAKLSPGIKNKAEVYKTQATVDTLVQEFGPDNEQQGIDKIRSQHSGPEEERLVSAYKQRIGELTVKSVNEDNELRKAQAAYFDDIKVGYFQKGSMPTREQLDADLDGKKINVDQYRTALSWNETMVTRAQVTKQLAKDQNWNNLSPVQQEEQVMKGMGVNQEQRDAVLNTLKAGVLDGSMSNAEIDNYYQNGMITGAERERFRKMDTQISRDQKDFVTSQKKALSTDMSGLKIAKKGGKLYEDIAAAEFADRVSRLDPASKTYRADVMDARRDAMVSAVEKSGKSMETGWIWKEPTPLAKRYEAAKTSIEEATGGVKEYTPDFKADNIALSMVSGGKQTSGFTDWRAYRNGQHNGVDIAAPEGTPIVSPDMGVPLTVSMVRSGSKTAGNYVILEGTLTSGNKVSMQVSHMKDGSVPLKVGDVVNPGGTIGQVGQTGVGSGPHMDLKVKINGKYVDPAAIKPSMDDIFKGGFSVGK